MIDFRFHLISVVAVLLALGMGIVAGSGFLGDALVSEIERRVEQVRAENDALHAEIQRLDRRIDADRSFAEAIEPALVDGALAGRAVVLVEVEGVASDVVDGVRAVIEDAGAEIATTMTLTEKLALPGRIEADQLALAVGSVAASEDEIARDAADLLGTRLGAAGAPSPPPNAAGRAVDLLGRLAEAGFVEVGAVDERVPIPAGALVVVAGGGEGDPPYDVAAFVEALALRVVRHDVPALVAEPIDSGWGLVAEVRADQVARRLVSTVDQADTIPGGIAVVLGLRRALARDDDEAGHYGVGPGATSVVPDPVTAGEEG